MRKSFWYGLAGFMFVTMSFFPSAMASDETINLRLSSFVPPMHFMNKAVLEPWIEMVEEKTNGKVKIRLYAGGALGKPEDQYEMAVRGAADITWGILAYNPGRFNLPTVMELPFMSPSAEIGSQMVYALFKEGFFDKEFHDVKLLSMAMPPTMDIHSKQKAIKTLEDLKGMNIRTPSPMIGKLIKKWGGAPVAVPLPEVYLSLERGVIDSIFVDPLTLMGIRCHEVTNSHTRVGISTTVVFFAMNKDKWSKLPENVQKVIEDLSGEFWGEELNGKRADKAVLDVMEKLKASGHTVHELTPEERKRWEESAATAVDEWVKTMEDKGLPGKAVLTEALRLKAEYTK